MKRIFALLVLSISYTVALAQIVTGSYTGNGTSQNITAPGFQPDIVIIKRAGSTGTPQHGQVRIAGMSTTMDMFYNQCNRPYHRLSVQWLFGG